MVGKVVTTLASGDVVSSLEENRVLLASSISPAVGGES